MSMIFEKIEPASHLNDLLFASLAFDLYVTRVSLLSGISYRNLFISDRVSIVRDRVFAKI